MRSYSEEIQSYSKNLQKFQIELLSIFESAFPQDSAVAEDLCQMAEEKTLIDELFSLNAQILKFINDVSGKMVSRQHEFFELLADIMKNLVEVEHFVTMSCSKVEKTYADSKEFSEILDRNSQDIRRAFDTHCNIDDLKSFITSKLETIKDASRRKLEIEEKQLHGTTGEVEALRSQIKAMGKQVSRAQRRAETMEKASLLDPLTGVTNRRGYQKYMRETWALCTHSGEAFSILMIDIDNFKSINDTFGHWAGDKCLSELARRIRINLRGTDLLARYGGEEFIAVLPKTDLAGAVGVAEKLRAYVEQTRFLYRGDRIPLTVSIGVSIAEESDKSVKSVLDRVDRALYTAKKNGRNCVSAI